MRRTLLAALVMALIMPFGAVAEEVDTPAQDWKGLSRAEQGQLVSGILLGCRSGVMKAAEVLVVLLEKGEFKMPASRFKVVRKDMYERCLDDKLSVVVEGVTKLYQDPANTYIGVWDAVDISILTTRGKQVDSQLREARQGGYDSFTAVQKERRKE